MSAIGKILEDAHITAYQLDARRVTPFIQIGKKDVPEGTLLACTANYSWKGEPIGICFDQDRHYQSIRKHEYERPSICFGEYVWLNYQMVRLNYKVAAQIGPTLVSTARRNGSYVGVVDIGTVREKFRADAVRKSSHVGYGITTVGKLIVAYFQKATLQEMAEYFVAQKCILAAKADGGHAAYLECPGDKLRLGNQGIVPVALCFKERK
jgi:hypothetical protein